MLLCDAFLLAQLDGQDETSKELVCIFVSPALNATTNVGRQLKINTVVDYCCNKYPWFSLWENIFPTTPQASFLYF